MYRRHWRPRDVQDYVWSTTQRMHCSKAHLFEQPRCQIVHDSGIQRQHNSGEDGFAVTKKARSSHLSTVLFPAVLFS